MTDWNSVVSDKIGEGAFETDKERELSNSMFQGVQFAPTQAAQVDILSRDTGLPFDTVERNFKQVDETNRWNKLDLKKILNDSPTTGEFLSDTNNARQAHDDADTLSWLEKIARGYKRGVQVDRAGVLGFQQLMQFDPDRQKELDAINTRIAELTPQGEEGFFSEWVDPASEIVGQMLQSMGAASDEAMLGAGAGAAAALTAGQMGPQIATPEELLTVPAATLTGMGWGFRAGMAEHAFKVEAGHSYSEMMSIKGEDGQPLDPELAKYGAISVGVINASLEMIGLEAVSAPARDMIKKYTTAYVKDALRNKSMRDVVTNFAKRYATAWGTEVSTEVLQEIVNMEAVEIVKQLSEGDFEDLTRDEWYERLNEIFSKVGRGMALLALPGPVANIRSDIRQVRESKTEQQRLDELNKAVEDSKLKQNNPQAFRDLLQRIGENSGTDTVYLDPEAAKVFFQDTEVDAELLENPSVQAIISGIDNALENGSMIEIPLESYATDLVGTEIQTGLQQHMTLDPDTLTAEQAANLDVKAQIEELAAMDEEQRTAEAEVYNDQLGQLLAAGYERDTAEQYAMLYEATFRALSERPDIKAQGVSPMELYQRYNPTVGREVDPRLQQRAQAIEGMDLMLDRLRAGDVPVDKDIFGESIIQFIVKKGGIRDEGGELDWMDADVGRVGRNRIARKDGDSFDGMAEKLVEEGFIPERSENAVIEAIRNELKGQPTYRLGTENQRLMETRDQLESLAQMLDEAGIDINTMTNEQIRDALREGVSETAMTQYQEALAPPPLADEQDFKGATIEETITDPKTGRKAVVRDSAQKKFDQAMQRRSALEEIRRCLSGKG